MATTKHHLAVEAKVEELKPSKRDINSIIMDYLVAEGFPSAAEKFSQETDIAVPDLGFARVRVAIRNAIHSGDIQTAIELINDVNPEVLDADHSLHFNLLRLHLIELIRAAHDSAPSGQPPPVTAFQPALEFATSQLSPRAPTDPKYQQDLEQTMALMIFDQNKMTPEFKELLNVDLREKIAADVNKALRSANGERNEARIRSLLRARAWAESQAWKAGIELPSSVPLGFEAEAVDTMRSEECNSDAMVT